MLLVFSVDLRHLLGMVVLRLPGKSRRIHLGILGIGNGGQEPRKGIELLVQVQLFQSFLQHVFAVGRIIDGKDVVYPGRALMSRRSSWLQNP